MATKRTKRIVVVRSAQSGVWIGEFIKQDGDAVSLKAGRKIWRWRGANTTSELALHGCSVGYSRVSAPVDVTVLGCCEVLESNAQALAAVAKCGWAP